MGDRKYRHRGYQDDDWDRDRDRKQRPPQPQTDERGQPRLEGAPRGRGVGLPTEVVFKCARCGHTMKNAAVEPASACPSCGKALHTCTNCTFFDTSARFECRKPIAARIEPKTKANRCELFQPKAVRDLRSAQPEAPRDARAAFNALFKK
jgi:predicted RNA-binding Zn-ribbon protein involved in translation (DUF1610 family)